MSYRHHPVAADQPVRVALIGAGWIGKFHAESIAKRIPTARLEAITEPWLPAVQELAFRLGVRKISTDVQDVLADPDVDAVLIAAPMRFHSDLITAAARAYSSPDRAVRDRSVARSRAVSSSTRAGSMCGSVAAMLNLRRRVSRAYPRARRNLVRISGL